METTARMGLLYAILAGDSHLCIIKENNMADIKDQYGNKLGEIRSNGIFDKYGSKVGEIRSNGIFNKYGSKVAEVRGSDFYDIYGSRLSQFPWHLLQ
jgi:hypothetical protein